MLSNFLLRIILTFPEKILKKNGIFIFQVWRENSPDKCETPSVRISFRREGIIGSGRIIHFCKHIFKTLRILKYFVFVL